MDVFDLWDRVVAEYASYVKSFFTIRASPIKERLEREFGNDGFPVLRARKERDLGEYRTRGLVLDPYFRLSAARPRDLPDSRGERHDRPL